MMVAAVASVGADGRSEFMAAKPSAGFASVGAA
jgi:hypothetical protein